MTHITVERMSGDLEKQEWRFLYLDHRHALALTHYNLLKRRTNRHKFQSEEFYDTYMRRGSSLIEADVPLPDDVKEEVRQKFIEGLRIGKFDEYR